MDFAKIKARYENELYERVIPFWEQHCVDRQYGGYFTSLDRDGSVYDTEKYMWMQWLVRCIPYSKPSSTSNSEAATRCVVSPRS